MDEMGMTSLDEMHAIVGAVSQGGGKFVGTGDVEQTQAVGRGAPMRAMLEQAGSAVMDEVIRQKEDWQRQATIAFETQNTGEGIDAYNNHGCIIFADTAEKAKNDIVERWAAGVERSNVDVGNNIIIAYKNETVEELNLLARSKLAETGRLKNSKKFKVANGYLELAIGDRVLFGRNDYKEINVRNGYFGTVMAIEGSVLTVDIDKKGKVEIDLDKYNHLKYGYAATVHKLQGYTGDNSFQYIDGRGWDRHLMLVGASRHRNNLTVVADKQTFGSYEDLKAVISRYGLKDHALEYPAGFSIRRGFEPDNVAKRAVRFIRKTSEKVYDSWLYLVNYQEYMLQHSRQEIVKYAKEEATKGNRAYAVIVADFCDNRIAVAESIGKLEYLKGEQKEILQQKIYQLQLKNGELANEISKDMAGYKLAMDRNRISESDINNAMDFTNRHSKVKGAIDQYLLNKFYNPVIADEIYTEIKTNYKHIASILPQRKHTQDFVNDLRNMAMIRRYETAFKEFAKFRPEIKNVKSYCDLNYEIGKELQARRKGRQFNEHMHSILIKRDALAYEISVNANKYNKLLEHFNIDKEKLAKHVQRYHDRALVKKFSKMQASTFAIGNLQKQILAHKIKKNSNQYRMYIDDFLKDGWKSINLENWRFERAAKISQSSREFKKSLRIVRKYYAASSLARDAWFSAIKRREHKSPNYKEHLKRAQALSQHRDSIASLLINNMEIHAGALAFEKVDLAKLGRRAKSYDYLQSYTKDKHEETGLYYDSAKPINYTLAEIYLRQEKGLVGVDLSDLRFNSSVKLPDGQKTSPAIIIPAVNERGEIKAEQILYLDNAGKKVIGTHINGEEKNCAVIVQRGDKITTVYYANNIVDAKSIAVVDKQVNIFMSLQGYDDLSDISWTLNQLPRKPGAVAVTTDNFQKNTESVLYDKTSIFRKMGINKIRMAKGDLGENYTHIRINDALIRTEKIRGTNYIKTSLIEEPVQEKISLKDKLSKAVGLKKEPTETLESVTKPKIKSVDNYYLQLSAAQLKDIDDYFNAVEQLEKADSYKAALNVVGKANKVYDSLESEIEQMKQHPQQVYRTVQTVDMATIKDRIGQGASLGLNDLTGLLQEVAKPKLDTETKGQLTRLSNLIDDPKNEKEFKRIAKRFSEDKKILINAWSKNKNMPPLSHSYFVPDAVKDLNYGQISRESLSRIYQMVEQITVSGLTKKSRKLDNEEKWGGGRGGWSY